MRLNHACRIPPSLPAVYSFKKKEKKKKLLQKKQTLPGLVTLDAWQVLITMVRFDASLDLFLDILQKKRTFLEPMILLELKTKQILHKFCWDDIKVEKGERGKWHNDLTSVMKVKMP